MTMRKKKKQSTLGALLAREPKPENLYGLDLSVPMPAVAVTYGDPKHPDGNPRIVDLRDVDLRDGWK